MFNSSVLSAHFKYESKVSLFYFFFFLLEYRKLEKLLVWFVAIQIFHSGCCMFLISVLSKSLIYFSSFTTAKGLDHLHYVWIIHV